MAQPLRVEICDAKSSPPGVTMRQVPWRGTASHFLQTSLAASSAVGYETKRLGATLWVALLDEGLR